MPLHSKLLRGDHKLEAASVSDPSHIVPGARGEHVRKIQLALIRLDAAILKTDGIYGPSTASAVLAYKQKRNIINHKYQAKADNIVGKMTVAFLDREMIAKESVPVAPIQIRPLRPTSGDRAPVGALAQRANLRFAFSVNVNVPVQPGGTILNIRLEPRTFGVLEIINGQSGTVTGHNVVPAHGDCREKTSFVFDPAQPSFVPVVRLIPEPRGPFVSESSDLQNGGKVQVTKDPFVVHVDAFRPGDAFIDATAAASSSTVFLQVRASKLPSAAGGPLVNTRPNSKLLSAEGIDGNVPGGFTGGRPVNPIGTGRKINLGGQGETPGFEDYTPDLDFSAFPDPQTNKFIFRPWTEDSDLTVGVTSGSASDICIRGVPIKDRMIQAIRRIAGSKCRLTFSGGADGLLALKKAFPFPPVEEFSQPNSAMVIQFP